MNLNKAPDCFGHHNNHASENSYFRFVLLCLSILPSHTLALWSMAFRDQKPLLATPDSAFHSPEQQWYSQTLFWAPTRALERWPAAAPTGSTLRADTSLPRQLAMHSSTETGQPHKLGSWMEALALVSYTSYSFFYSFFHAWSGKWLNQISTTWLSKSTPCAHYGSGTKREIPVNAAVCHAVCRWLHSTTWVCFLHLL